MFAPVPCTPRAKPLAVLEAHPQQAHSGWMPTVRRQSAQPYDGGQREKSRRKTRRAVKKPDESHAPHQQPFPAAVGIDDEARSHAAESAHYGSARKQKSHLGQREAHIFSQIRNDGAQNALEPVFTGVTGGEQGEKLPFLQGFVSFMAK